MPNAVAGLKPEALWKYFAEIAAIPRCSKNEAAVSKYVIAAARRMGLEAKTDRLNNVVVKKPATPGREGSRSVCLQGHLDMVCEKNKDKVFDFRKDPIEIVRSGNFLTANGTTLGADNGVAVATNLALMEEKGAEHGPLEFLFTVDEETGLTGANGLEPGFVESRILLNLDSEEEGALYVGCAGGVDTTAAWDVEGEPAPAGTTAFAVRVTGLKGGHSGLEIDKGRGNAVKILNRVLLRLGDLGGRLALIEGGNKHNAIPREAEALVFLPKKKVDAARDLVERLAGNLKAEMAAVDPDLEVEMEAQPRRRGKVWKRSLQRKVLRTLSALPHGVVKMSAEIAGLVETSTNLAVIRTERRVVTVVTSQRSSVGSENAEIAETVRTIFELAGARVSSSDGYPAWTPNLSSEILSTARSVYKSMFGGKPQVKAIHAGLECGIIGEKYPGMDMVSFGPTLEAVHSPDERIHIDTVERFWRYLLGILERVR